MPSRRLFLLSALALAAIGPAPALGQLESGIGVGKPAPAVVIADLEGVPWDLGTVLGKKPVLIEFWATWCSLCKSLLPQLERIRSEYGDRVELVGVNVTVNDPKNRVRRYLAEHRPPFRALYDEKGAGARAYDVPSTSFIVIVDAQGKVAYTGVGEDQDLISALRKVVGR